MSPQVTNKIVSVQRAPKLKGDNLKVVLDQVFNFKLGYFCNECNCMACTSTPTSRVENAA